MHCEIYLTRGERFFNFFSEHALSANLGQGDVGDLVSGGVDDLDFNFKTTRAQERGDVVGLPEGELGAAGADAKFS
jgi:hypothetical protein